MQKTFQVRFQPKLARSASNSYLPKYRYICGIIFFYRLLKWLREFSMRHKITSVCLLLIIICTSSSLLLDNNPEQQAFGKVPPVSVKEQAFNSLEGYIPVGELSWKQPVSLTGEGQDLQQTQFIEQESDTDKDGALATKISVPQRKTSHRKIISILIMLSGFAAIALNLYITQAILRPFKVANQLASLIARKTDVKPPQGADINRLLQYIATYIEELEKSEAQHQALLDAVPDLLLRIHKDGTYLDFRPPKNFELLVPNRKLIGSNIYDILPLEVASQRMYHIKHALSTGKPQVFEYQVVSEDQVYDYEARIVVSGKDEVLFISRDISHDKQAKQTLTRLAAIIEATPDFVGTCDRDGKPLYLNQAGRRMMGIDDRQDISKRGIVEYYPQWAQEVLLEIGLPTAIRNGIWSGEAAILTRSGREIPVWQVIIAHKANNGKVEFISTIASNITETKQAQESLRQKARELEIALSELKQAQAQLVQKEKMSSLGQMVAGIAHEFNNPISFIYGNVQYANDYIQNLLNLIKLYKEEYPQSSDVIKAEMEEIDFDFLQKDLPRMMLSMKTGAERIRSLVISLRNFARLDEGDLKSVDIHEGIENALLLVNHRLNKGITVKKHYGKLPLVECYPAQLNQVFLNLLNNAIDALQQPAEYCKKQIVIETSVLQNQVEVRIRDTGHGIKAKIQNKIFDPFFTTKPVGKGTGLGLAISYQIVKQHDGEIVMNSFVDRGCEFVITIPIKQGVLVVA